MPNTVLFYAIFIPALVVAITFHEYAHARTALQFGDDTAARLGRVSLNPLVHLDPIGTLSLFLIGFGWGKPVPVSRDRLRARYADTLVSAAGPAANVLVAALCAWPLRSPAAMAGLDLLGAGAGARLLLTAIVSINIALACFNLLPIGPLDGAHAFASVLPVRQQIRFETFNHRHGYLVLLLLILLDHWTPWSPLAWVLRPTMAFLNSLLLGPGAAG
ncbi:MAG: site-2 protease family protein [Candidatus Omnitrophica bacterium]|nr:site-2 protease family protein [Candidatus Omnitrophota bacterium]